MSLADTLRGQRVGVALSSAFFGFFGHTGFLRALEAEDIQPVSYGGTSAGALVAAFGACDALDTLTDLLRDLRRRDFWDPGLSLGVRGRRGLLKGQRFEALLRAHLPVDTFEACAHPLLTVSTNLTTKTRHVDTTGDLASAVHASCALPLLFEPVMRDGAMHCDGGLLDKAPVWAMVERGGLDVLVVHRLPSSSLTKPVPRAPMAFLNMALDLVRDDSLHAQIARAEARGVEVHIITTTPPRVGPFTLRRGMGALDEAQRQTAAQLSR